MPISGDVVDLDLGQPKGREAGYLHPVVVITAQRILDAEPTVIRVVQLTSTLRSFHSGVTIEPDSKNGLTETSAAQCQHVRAVSPRESSAHGATSVRSRCLRFEKPSRSSSISPDDQPTV